jgi:ubiquitin thioesterase protein OTUB1
MSATPSSIFFRQNLINFRTPTALAFAYLLLIMESSDQYMAVASALSILESTKPLLEDAGFQLLVYEDFYDVLASLVQQVVTAELGGTILTKFTLLEAFQSPEGTSIVHTVRTDA